MQDVFKKLSLDKIVFTDVKDDDGNIIDTIPETESREYMLIMNINVLEKIDNKYKTEDKDGFKAWAETAESENSKSRYDALSFFLTQCVNEGIRLTNKHRKEVNLKLLDYFKDDELNMSIDGMMSVSADIVSKSTNTGKN